MNELKGKFVNIVLSVEEGRGFGYLRQPFYVSACFNGRKMESDIVEGPNVVFSTEMVWETEKKYLRKARGSYGIIRLECLTSEKKTVGFSLLCLRSAKIIPGTKPTLLRDDTPIPWTKLLNVPSEFKKGNPELRVYLMICDHMPNVTIKSAMSTFNTSPHLRMLPMQPIDQLRVPIRYADDGYIQLGTPEIGTSKFQLKLSLLVGSDLDVLLPESMIFGMAAKRFQLSVELFGLDVKTRQVTEVIYSPNLTFNEAVVINLQSTFSMLVTYFKQYPEIKIKFYAENKFLAWSLVDMRLMTLDEEAFVQYPKRIIEMEQVCFFEGHYRATSSAVAMRRATITVDVKLEAVDYFPTNDNCPELQSEQNAAMATSGGCSGGDNLSAIPVQVSISSGDESSAFTSDSSDIDSDDLRDNIDFYRQFLVEIKVDSMIWKTNLIVDSFILKLVHPKTEMCISREIRVNVEKDKKTRIENAMCSIGLVSLKSRLNYMMMHYLPRIELVNAETHVLIGKAANLNLTKFHINKPGPGYKATLTSSSGEEIAVLNVGLLAKEMKDILTENVSLHHLTPCILDESIIIQSLDEVNDWKTNIRNEFEEYLSTEKAKEIERLRGEWRSRTYPLQEELLRNLEKCRSLVERQSKERQLADIDMEVETRQQSVECGIALEIHKNTIKYSLADKQELIEKISEVEVKNAILRDLLSEQSTQMQEVKETQLTAEQTKALLRDLKAMEEKYAVAQQDKNYFKKEYENAVKEVHSLKIDYHKTIASKIASDKQALNTFVSVKENDSERVTIPEPFNVELPDMSMDVDKAVDECEKKICN